MHSYHIRTTTPQAILRVMKTALRFRKCCYLKKDNNMGDRLICCDDINRSFWCLICRQIQKDIIYNPHTCTWAWKKSPGEVCGGESATTAWGTQKGFRTKRVWGVLPMAGLYLQTGQNQQFCGLRGTVQRGWQVHVHQSAACGADLRPHVFDWKHIF